MLSECAPPTVVSLSVTFSDGVRGRWVAGREGCPASNSSPAGAASPHHLPVHKGGLWVVVRCQPLRIHKGLPLQWKLLHQCQLSAAGASLVPYAASGVCACVNRGSYPARRIHAEGFGTGCCQSPPRSVPRRSRIRPFQIRVSFFSIHFTGISIYLSAVLCYPVIGKCGAFAHPNGQTGGWPLGISRKRRTQGACCAFS